jgi:hypothetical protein
MWLIDRLSGRLPANMEQTSELRKDMCGRMLAERKADREVETRLKDIHDKMKAKEDKLRAR